MMTEWLTAILILIGATFSFLAAVGAARMPDFYTRLQTSTKAVTLGVGFLVLAAAIQYEAGDATTRALLVVAFLTLTAPVAAHVLARAAYAEAVPLWENVIIDELKNTQRPLPEALDEGDAPTASSVGESM